MIFNPFKGRSGHLRPFLGKIIRKTLNTCGMNGLMSIIYILSQDIYIFKEYPFLPVISEKE